MTPHLTFLDTETTGTDPERHNVWEIGMISAHGEFNWILQLDEEELASAEPMALAVGHYYQRAGEAFEKYAEEGRFMPVGASGGAVPANRATWADLMRGHPYVTLADRATLADFLAREIGTSHLVGAVPNFDARFVGDLMRAHNRPPSWHYHLVDVEALAAGKLGRQPPWKSKDLYRALGLNPSYFAEHTALGDTRMAKAIYELVFDLKPSWPSALIAVREEI